jgi:hypothetical protein
MSDEIHVINHAPSYLTSKSTPVTIKAASKALISVIASRGIHLPFWYKKIASIIDGLSSSNRPLHWSGVY